MTVPSIARYFERNARQFSDGGQYQSTDAAIAQGSALAQMGADFIDVGGDPPGPVLWKFLLKRNISHEPVIKHFKYHIGHFYRHTQGRCGGGCAVCRGKTGQ